MRQVGGIVKTNYRQISFAVVGHNITDTNRIIAIIPKSSKYIRAFSSYHAFRSFILSFPYIKMLLLFDMDYSSNDLPSLADF